MNRKRLGLFILICFLLLAFPPASKSVGDALMVFCGAAVKPAMEEIAALFEKEQHVKVNLVFGGSGTMLAQMELSKTGDVYIPGSPDYAVIGRRKKIITEEEKIIAYLVPGLITPKGNPARIKNLADLARPGVRVGLGNPETVCLGLYAIEILEKSRLLNPVMKNTVTMAASCEETANLVALDKVDAVIGWSVFQSWNPSRIAYIPLSSEQIPRLSYIPLTFPIYTRHPELAKRFSTFVLSPAGLAIYEKYGYITELAKAKSYAPKAGVGGEYKLPPEYFSLLQTIWK